MEENNDRVSPTAEELIQYIHEHPEKTLMVYAKTDVHSEKRFFIAENGRLLLDDRQLSNGFKQWGQAGRIRPPIEEWYEQGKIDISVTDIELIDVDENLMSFLHRHLSDRSLIGAEVGVWEAKGALRMFRFLDIEKLYLIDPYEENPDFQPWNHDLLKAARELAFDRLLPYEERIDWIYRKSEDALLDIKELLDFCYLDSAHCRSVVSLELPLAYSIVRDDGVLAGHDYSNCFFNSIARNYENIEVRSTVDAFVIERNLSPFYYSGTNLQWFLVKNGIYNPERETA